MNDFNVGDMICYVDTPSQTGEIVRMHPLSVRDKNAFVVKMIAGPMHPQNKMMAFFSNHMGMIEKM